MTAKDNQAAPQHGDLAEHESSRRRFLTKGTVVATSLATMGLAEHAMGQSSPAGATAGGSIGSKNLPPNVPEWERALGAPTAKPYGTPSKFESEVIRRMHPGASVSEPMSAYSTSPLQDLDGIITPNGLFYERHHAGVPQIDPAQHRLMIHGLVKRPLIFEVDELRQLPSESHIYFLECSGNPTFLPPYGKTAAEVAGLVSCAEWTGVPLKALLKQAGVQTSAKWVIAEGADGASMTRSIPLDKCLDDVLVVYSQNGERLRPEQGYPLRLIVPGFEGNMNIKWLRRLHVTDQPVHSREETSRYSDLMPDGRSREFTFLMECKSLITSPSGSQRLTRKGMHEIRGIAWSGRGKIEQVDISIDGGDSWQPATLQQPVLNKALTAFRAPFEWNGEERVIMSRAVDESGYVQPTFEQLVAVRGRYSNYHNNAIQPWRIATNGEITNARK